MNTIKLRLLSLVSLVMASACFASVAGNYELDGDSVVAGLKKMPEFSSAPDAQQKQMMSMVGMMKMSLRLSEDGTFSVKTEMMGRIRESSGEWKREGDELLVKTLFDNGKEDPTPEEGRIKVEGDTLIITEDELMFPLALKRVAGE